MWALILFLLLVATSVGQTDPCHCSRWLIGHLHSVQEHKGIAHIFVLWLRVGKGCVSRSFKRFQETEDFRLSQIRKHPHMSVLPYRCYIDRNSQLVIQWPFSVDCASLKQISFGTIFGSQDFDNASLCCLSCKSLKISGISVLERVIYRMHTIAEDRFRQWFPS